MKITTQQIAKLVISTHPDVDLLHLSKELNLSLVELGRITRGVGSGKSNFNVGKETISELEDYFTELSGLRPPTAYSRTSTSYRERGFLWVNPLKAMYVASDKDIDKCRDAINTAVSRLREAELTIYSPKSVLKVAMSILAEESQDSNVVVIGGYN